MNTENMIEITGCDLVKVAKAAYRLSKPQGLGFLHFKDGELDADSAQKIVEDSSRNGIALSMDYVNGRACKLTVFKHEDKLFIRNSWYDHSEEQLDQLIRSIKTEAA